MVGDGAHDPRVVREQRFHDDAFSDQRRAAIGTFYRIAGGSRDRYRRELYRPGVRRVLEWGCGPGSSALDLARRGAHVSAIDISPVAIERAAERARAAGVDLDLHVMDAHRLEFPDASFDLVCGQGILHHLRIEDAYREAARVLCPSGAGVFLEPLGHNPVINVFRRLTPAMRTPDERPLRRRDVELARRFFGVVEVEFFHLSALALLPFRRVSWVEEAAKLADRWDTAVFRVVPPLRWWSWIAVIVLREPLRR